MDPRLSDLLGTTAASVGVPLPDEKISLFARYYQELVFWNRKINLIGATGEADLILKHFIDSLTAVPLLPPEAMPLLDIGSGGGLPGIPIKIARTDLPVDLLEASRKKTSFLRHAIRQLALPGIRVLHGRAEGFLAEGSYRNAYGLVISRATCKLPDLLILGGAFLRPGGLLLAMKGPAGDRELQDSEKTMEFAGLQCTGDHAINLPLSGGQRKIIIFRKRFQINNLSEK